MKKNIFKKVPQSGFTLIEILIVIGVIAILAAIVLVAVNPSRQFAQANNAQRSSNVAAISSAIAQYIVDNKGEISGLGLAAEDDNATEKSITDEHVDICDILVPTYMPAFPTDPKSTSKGVSISEDDCDDYTSGYSAWVSDDGRITVSAPLTENVDDGGTTPAIEVTR